MLKICEKCRKEFECFHSEKCWCVKQKISKEVSEILKTQFKDCLCKDCLKKLIAKDKKK